ncbi:Protein LOW PSII ACCUMULATION 1 [Durusdinium trenchii]|uniref:Chloroplastic n=1 Tax=Durusdinium trenchii TaxID=1381693 RepID=A0ABP0JYH3_9DINO
MGSIVLVWCACICHFIPSPNHRRVAQSEFYVLRIPSDTWTRTTRDGHLGPSSLCLFLFSEYDTGKNHLQSIFQVKELRGFSLTWSRAPKSGCAGLSSDVCESGAACVQFDVIVSRKSTRPVKKIPKIGDDKYVIESRVVFQPQDESVNAFTRISFSMVLNTDVLPNSCVQGPARSGEIKLSGANGPLFRGEVGYWDQDQVLLTVQMISTVQIYAGVDDSGERRRPFSAYPNDPSFRLAVPEAGIPERPFLFSTRVSQQGKEFGVSEIFYGSRGAVAYPNTVVEFNFRHVVQWLTFLIHLWDMWSPYLVNLPAGTTVRLTLPGFTCPFTSVPIGTQEVPVLGEKDLSDFIRFGQWNQMDNTFDLVVPVGQAIYRQLTTAGALATKMGSKKVLRIMQSGGFRLPITPLLPDDTNVVVFEVRKESTKGSFQVSEFIYAPPQQDSIFQLKMLLQPTVNITHANDIVLFLCFLRRSEFDLLSLQEFRREALIQYSNTNQSEPLRILIFFLFTVSALSAPAFAPSNAALWYYALAVLFSVVFGFLFVRERGKRTAQLVRLEREYAIGDLPVELFNPTLAASRGFELQALRGSKRVVALFGSFQQVKESLRSARPYRRRFVQSDVLILPVCSSLEGADEVAFAAWGEAGLRASRDWLARPQALRRWRSYFQGILEDKEVAAGQSLWVGLSLKGRVFGSDFGIPIWDEILAAMPPTKALSSTEELFALAETSCGALEAQKDFYDALTGGDVERMRGLFEAKDDAELSAALQVEQEQSNLSGWDMVLAAENRPQLVTASFDCVKQSETRAITTCIEFPVLGPTLLATQLWARSSEGEPWRLQSHRSIPYASGVEARVALRCDHRGCIAFGKPGFRNSLSKVNIHIMGEDRGRIQDSMGSWNETTARLTLKVPLREVIPAFTMLDLRVEESQGFILPSALNANDTSLRISSLNNIQEEPIKTSPMVGNGPFTGHLYCMFQYEVGTRSPSPICPTAIDCNPPLTDPCNPSELTRCGCDARVDEIFPMMVLGFNLQNEDSVHFLPYDQLCNFDLIGPTILNPFSEPLSQTVSENRDQVTYEGAGMTSISTGIYRVCANHVGRLYDVGMVIVRPSCQVPLVLVDGACVEHCPRTKVPVAGKCIRDTMAFHALDTVDGLG